jgi:ParB family transcriptional regulator, chromosome partitioning protein
MSKTTTKGLGRGFGSLLPDDFDQSILLDKEDRVQKIQITDIKADPNQPRQTFDQDSINELAQSIKRYGVLQPIVVTQQNSNYYIVAGERRYRAAKKAGLTHMPVLVRSLEELERLEISLVENVQRVDLNPVEQAISIVRLHEQFNVSYQEIAQRLGKAHSTIVNIVRLLQLPDFARQTLSAGRITEGHARAILALKDEKLQKTLLDSIEKQGWSVRRAEQFVSENRKAHTPKTAVRTKESEAARALSQDLTKRLGVRIKVSPAANGGGKVALKFDSKEQLDKFITYLHKLKKY